MHLIQVEIQLEIQLEIQIEIQLEIQSVSKHIYRDKLFTVPSAANAGFNLGMEVCQSKAQMRSLSKNISFYWCITKIIFFSSNGSLNKNKFLYFFLHILHVNVLCDLSGEKRQFK